MKIDGCSTMSTILRTLSQDRLALGYDFGRGAHSLDMHENRSCSLLQPLCDVVKAVRKCARTRDRIPFRCRSAAPIIDFSPQQLALWPAVFGRKYNYIL